MRWFGGLLMVIGWFVTILGTMSVGRYHLFGSQSDSVMTGFAIAWGELAIGVVVILIGRSVRRSGNGRPDA
jgi:hypothetical protein